jgi:glycerol-3-phosphate dehydrogenase
MNRDTLLRGLRERAAPWDVLVVGGGASGLGAAVDAASRGYATLLLEQQDFAHGTSSRSTKLIHGGVRYLAQGRVGLVQSALRERALLFANAPHLVHDLSFVIPAYSWAALPYYYLGLKTYELLGGAKQVGPARWISRAETLQRLPTLLPTGLKGGVLYHDGQFDDARLAVTLARTLADLGGTPLNYMQVVGLRKEREKTSGVRATDIETGETFEIKARVVVNATGVFTDRTLQMDDARSPPLVAASQGAHLVLPRHFLPGDCAIMVPRTSDGRVLFAIPWQARTLVGTTDTPVADPDLEPRPLEHEIDFLLEHAARYLTIRPTRDDVLCLFAGQRPLVAATSGQRTASLSRDHRILVSASGLVTLAGGKWTTYRQMGEELIDKAAEVAGLPHRTSTTRQLRLHGCLGPSVGGDAADYYGSDTSVLADIIRQVPALQSPLHHAFSCRMADVVMAARYEMARTVFDVLARRTRALFLDARASIEAAPAVAQCLARELGRSETWASEQVGAYCQAARAYLPSG